MATGCPASPFTGSSITIDIDVPGSLTLTGSDITLGGSSATSVSVTTQGLLTLTGQTVGTSAPTTTVDVPGTLTLDGQDVGLRFRLAASPGLLSLSGQEVSVTAVPPDTGRLFGDGLFGGDTFGGYLVVAEPPSPDFSYRIEVDFTTPLLDLPSDWTDITEWVRNFSTRRGRSHELGKMQAGEASLTLDNRDRRFDPTFVGGIIPMRHARIRVTTPDADYTLFRGYVEDWGQQWSGPAALNEGDAVCEAYLVDAFSVLNRIDITSYPTEVLADEPIGYWPLTDLDGTAMLADLGSGNVPFSTKAGDDENLRIGTATGPLAGGGTAMDYVGGSNATWTTGALPEDYSIKGDATVESWVYVPSGWNAQLIPVTISTGGFDRAGFYIDNDEIPKAAAYDETNSIHTAAASNAISVDLWHHIAWVRRGNRVSFFIDGDLNSTAQLNPPAFDDQTLTITADFGFVGTGTGARIAHVAVYDRPLDAVRIQAHYAATLGEIQEMPVDQAIQTVLDAIGWPTSSLTPSTHVARAHIAEANALTELLMLAEETDGGLFFASADGTLTFRSADDLAHDTASLATWGDSSAELQYSDLVLRYDDQDLYTAVRASAEGLADAVASDPVAAVTYGPRTLETSGGVLRDQAQLNDRSTAFLRRYSAPSVRPESLTAVDSRTQPERTAEIFSSEIGRRVTVTRRPPGGGSAITILSMIEGVAHSPVGVLTQDRATLNLVPILDPVPWILGDSTYSVLGSTTDLGW